MECQVFVEYSVNLHVILSQIMTILMDAIRPERLRDELDPTFIFSRGFKENCVLVNNVDTVKTFLVENLRFAKKKERMG